MQNNNLKKVFGISMVLLAISLLPKFVPVTEAQTRDTYQVLAPLPGTYDTASGKTDLQRYLPGLFNFAIGISAAFVLLNLVFGGFQWMSSDAFTKKEEGKKRIENSLKGILLVAGAWIILYTISPKLLDVKLDIESVNIPSPSAPAGGGAGGGGGATQLQASTQGAVNDLKALCSGCVNITSTTGGQHTVGSDHYSGLAVDIAPNQNLNQFLVESTNPPKECGTVDKVLGSTKVRFLWEPKGSYCGGTVPSSGDHWHMSVKP